MVNSEFINCPFCNKSCRATADACSCGYVFNKEKYEEKEQVELKTAERKYEDKLFSFGGIGGNLGLLGGVVLMLIGAAAFILAWYAGKIYPYSVIIFVAGVLVSIKGIIRLFRK